MADETRRCRWCGADNEMGFLIFHNEGTETTCKCSDVDACRDRLAQQLKDANQLIGNLQSGGAIEGVCRLISEELWGKMNDGICTLRNEIAACSAARSALAETAEALREMLHGVTSELEVCLPILPNTPIGQETYQRIADKINEAQILLKPQAPSSTAPITGEREPGKEE